MSTEPLDADTFSLWNVLAETAEDTPMWKREDVRRLCATVRSLEAENVRLRQVLEDVASGYDNLFESEFSGTRTPYPKSLERARSLLSPQSNQGNG